MQFDAPNYSFDKYYYTLGDGFFTTEGWKDQETDNADASGTAITSGFYMEIVDDPYTVTLTPPDFYDDR